MKNLDTIKEWDAGYDDIFEPSTDEGGEKTAVQRGVRSEKGIVLVVVLILSAVVLAVMTAMIYMVTSGTQISGFQKRYKTSLEAAKGGSDLMYQVVAMRGNTSSFTSGVSITIPSSACQGTDIYSGLTTSTGFVAKLNSPSTTWNSSCNKSLTIDPKVSSTYDLMMTIGTAPQQYNFYAKISGALEGNSAGLLGNPLYSGSVITSLSGGGSIPVVSKPYMYAIEVYTENASNPAERAKLSILYQY